MQPYLKQFIVVTVTGMTDNKCAYLLATLQLHNDNEEIKPSANFSKYVYWTQQLSTLPSSHRCLNCTAATWTDSFHIFSEPLRFLLQHTSLYLTLTSVSSKYYVLTDIRLWAAGRDYNSPYFSQGTVVLNKLGNGVLSIL